jgi:TPR repeat protein
VENEVPEAIAFLGSSYHFGALGLVKSDKKAAKIWKRAVELGNVVAMVRLGYAYETGRGVKLDKKKAEELYRAAADGGVAGHSVAAAQNNLGVLLRSANKFEEAFRYFTLAANQGFTDGETNLSACYVNGTGAEVDLSKARYWTARAVAKGHETAIKNLARLDAHLARLDARS